MRELDGNPFRPAVAVRDVAARDDCLAGADSQEAPLVLNGRVVEWLDHRLESNAAEDADARVAGTAAEVPDALVPELLEVAQRQLAARRPDLLQADDIRLPLCDPPDQAATDGGPDAVHVQRDNVHGRDDASSVRAPRRLSRDPHAHGPWAYAGRSLGILPLFKRSSPQPHRVAVYDTRPAADDPKPFEPYFVAICECDWLGETRDSAVNAFADARAHSDEVDSDMKRPVG